MSGSKVKLSTRTANGLTYSMTGSSAPKSDNLKGEFSVKGSIRDITEERVQDVTLTTKLLTSSAPSAEISYERSDPLGRKVNLSFLGSDKLALLTSEIIQPKAGVTLSIDTLNLMANGSIATAIAPVEYGGFAVIGARGLFNLSEGTLSGARFAASMFDGKESEVTVEVEGQGEAGTLSYSHLVRPTTSVAASMRYTRESGTATGVMGLVTKVDEFTALKAKVDSDGQAGLSVIQNLRASTKIIMSTAFNLANFDTPKVGLSIAVS